MTRMSALCSSIPVAIVWRSKSHFTGDATPRRDV